MESNASPRQRTPNRLRKKPSQEKKKTAMPLGVKVKRISDYEPYSDRTRGTLGGFISLCDVSSDGGSVEKGKNVEKECILTQMTKKIGLGIYTRRRGAADGPGQAGKEVYLDAEGDERETWYMFYPPPPSPSLALDPEEWDSSSSTEIDPKSPTGFDFDFKPEEEEEKESPSIRSGPSRGSSYEESRTSPPVEDNPRPIVNSGAVNIDDLVHSAESLANEYRNLMPPGAPSPNPIFRSLNKPDSMRDMSSIPLPLAVSLNIPLPLPLPMPTPKTLRKVKRQHSLRRLHEPPPNNLFADFDFDPNLLMPEGANYPQFATRTPSPPVLSPSPDDVPSPNEPAWIMAPFTSAEAPAASPPWPGKHSHSPRIKPPTTPPRESSRPNSYSLQAGLDKYQTGEIPPRPNRPPKVRPVLIRRNAAVASARDGSPFNSTSTSKAALAMEHSPTPAPHNFPPSPPLSPSTSISRSKSFILPSVVLKGQVETAYHGLSRPQSRLQPNEQDDTAYVVVAEQSRSRSRRTREREKRYGIVVPSAAPTAVENGEAGWV